MVKRKRVRGNGEGSIIELSGKRKKPFAVRVTAGWTPEGKQIYKYVSYHETRTQAKDALRRYLVDPYDLDVKNITMMEVFEEWKKACTLSKITIDGYASAFKQTPRLHKKKMREVKAVDLKDAMKLLKPSMQSNFKNAIKNMYLHGIEKEIVTKDLSLFLKPEASQRKEKRPFNLEQIQQIRDFKHPYTDVVIILLYTGMRINELLEMKRENVNLEERYMYGGKKSKSGKTRYTPIHDEIFPLIKKYYDQGHEYLMTKDGSRIVYRTFMTVYWQRLKAHLGTDQTPHCTRHTFITYADRCDLDRKLLKKIVGHASLTDVTDHYSHRDMQELLIEINKLRYR